MASSRFDGAYVLFSLNYLLDGLLTYVAIERGLAGEGNVLAAGLAPHGFLIAKLLCYGLVTWMGNLTIILFPVLDAAISMIWRVGAVVFSTVCAWNLGLILTRVV